MRWTVNEVIYILTPFVLVLVGLLFLGSICASVLTVWPTKLLSHLDSPTLTVMRRISLVQTHYRYENARRNRVYGKRIPNTRVDTSELADRVGHYHLSGNQSVESVYTKNVHRRLASVTLFDMVPI